MQSIRSMNLLEFAKKFMRRPLEPYQKKILKEIEAFEAGDRVMLNPFRRSKSDFCKILRRPKMVDKAALHINQLEQFKEFLNSRGISHRPGKGQWQVLQVKTPQFGWQVIHKRGNMIEHYSVQDKLMSLVWEFLNSKKVEVKPTIEGCCSHGELLDKFCPECLEADLLEDEEDALEDLPEDPPN